MNKLQSVSALLSGLLLSVGAHAASVVPAASVTALTTDGTDTMTAIGGALIGVAVVAVLFKWGKAAIFG